MSQKTIFGLPRENSLKPFEQQANATNPSWKIIWQIVDKQNHWKTQVLHEFNNEILKKLNVCILSVSSKQIIFTISHPAILEKIKPLEQLILKQINSILQKPCPCGQTCAERPIPIQKLSFFVKYPKTNKPLLND